MGIKAIQAAAIIDNHMARMIMWSDPQGRASLLELRRYVVEKLLASSQAPNTFSVVEAIPYF
jgi:hypothetical protein